MSCETAPTEIIQESPQQSYEDEKPCCHCGLTANSPQPVWVQTQAKIGPLNVDKVSFDGRFTPCAVHNRIVSSIEYRTNCVHSEDYVVKCLWKRANNSFVIRDIFIGVNSDPNCDNKYWFIVSEPNNILATGSRSAYPSDATWKHSCRNPKISHKVTVTRQDPQKASEESSWIWPFKKNVTVSNTTKCPHCMLSPADKLQPLDVIMTRCDYGGRYNPCGNLSWKRVVRNELIERDVILTFDRKYWKWSFMCNGVSMQQCNDMDVKHPADAKWPLGEVRRIINH